MHPLTLYLELSQRLRNCRTTRKQVLKCPGFMQCNRDQKVWSDRISRKILGLSWDCLSFYRMTLPTIQWWALPTSLHCQYPWTSLATYIFNLLLSATNVKPLKSFFAKKSVLLTKCSITNRITRLSSNARLLLDLPMDDKFSHSCCWSIVWNWLVLNLTSASILSDVKQLDYLRFYEVPGSS